MRVRKIVVVVVVIALTRHSSMQRSYPQRTHTLELLSGLSCTTRGPSLAVAAAAVNTKSEAAMALGRSRSRSSQQKTLTTFKSSQEGALTPSSSLLSSNRGSAEFCRPALPAPARIRASLAKFSLPALARQKEMTPSFTALHDQTHNKAIFNIGKKIHKHLPTIHL